MNKSQGRASSGRVHPPAEQEFALRARHFQSSNCNLQALGAEGASLFERPISTTIRKKRKGEETRMRKLWKHLWVKGDQRGGIRDSIVVVSGLPRSGTSMMMKMLEAGGVPLLTDNVRQPDEDNPKGYYEFERVKNIPKGDVAWLEQARGKAVKIISALLEHLPPTYTYRVIFMRRDLREILASQRKMLIRRGEDPRKIDEEELYRLFTKHLQYIRRWLTQQPNFHVLEIPYNRILEEPRPYIHQINTFLGGHLDEEAMMQVIDPHLYRNRAHVAQDRI